jgi:hypothetical protein
VRRFLLSLAEANLDKPASTSVASSRSLKSLCLPVVMINKSNNKDGDDTQPIERDLLSLDMILILGRQCKRKVVKCRQGTQE